MRIFNTHWNSLLVLLIFLKLHSSTLADIALLWKWRWRRQALIFSELHIMEQWKQGEESSLKTCQYLHLVTKPFISFWHSVVLAQALAIPGLVQGMRSKAKCFMRKTKINIYSHLRSKNDRISSHSKASQVIILCFSMQKDVQNSYSCT